MVSVKIDFKKKDFVWISLIVVLLCVGLGVAYNSGVDPSVMGHSAEEIDFGDTVIDGDLNVTGDAMLNLDLYYYTKILMKAKHGNGDWDIFVKGSPGQTCNEICDSISNPAGDCVFDIQCEALWCEGFAAVRDYPPYRDPYFNYGCDYQSLTNAGSEGCVPMCMCNTGGCGWRDTSFSLPNGLSFW